MRQGKLRQGSQSKVGNSEQFGGNDVRHGPVTGATVIMEREVARWNDCAEVNILSGGVGEPLI